MPRPAYAGDVQPVPYTTSQPVPYAAPSQQAVAQPAPATSVPAGNDVVVLKNGGMIRGTLLEIIPNDHATVQLATGQNAIIQWDQVHHIERGGAATAKPATTAPAAAEEMVHVHIESDRPIVLERREMGNTWSLACTSPCDADIPLKQEYRVTGSGVRTSASFRLAAHANEHVTIDVNAGTRGGLAGGIVLVSLGSLAMLVGLIVVLAANTSESVDNSFGGKKDYSSTRNTGWVIAGVGTGGLIGGIVMIVGSKTTVELTGQRPARAAANAWSRLPTWHDDRSPLQGPSTMSVPLFSGAF